eukprot:scaffold501653_cov17-Prasinocladus_malaysianus.AAC.1
MTLPGVDPGFKVHSSAIKIACIMALRRRYHTAFLHVTSLQHRWRHLADALPSDSAELHR